MNVPVNLDHTQVERILAIIGPNAHGDFAEVDGDVLIADKLERALELARAQEAERVATSHRIAAERRASRIATAVDAMPLLDRIEEEINLLVESGASQFEKARAGVEHNMTFKRITTDITEAKQFALVSGTEVPSADDVLQRMRGLRTRVLVELLGIQQGAVDQMVERGDL